MGQEEGVLKPINILMLPVYRLFGNIWRDLSKQNQGDSVGELLS